MKLSIKKIEGISEVTKDKFLWGDVKNYHFTKIRGCIEFTPNADKSPKKLNNIIQEIKRV